MIMWTIFSFEIGHELPLEAAVPILEVKRLMLSL